MNYTTFQYDGVDVRVEEPFLKGEKKVSPKKPVISQKMLEDSLKPIMSIGKKVIDEAVEFAPDEVAVEFGLNVGFESGNLCWGFAKGTAATHFTVTMTWKAE